MFQRVSPMPVFQQHGRFSFLPPSPTGLPVPAIPQSATANQTVIPIIPVESAAPSQTPQSMESAILRSDNMRRDFQSTVKLAVPSLSNRIAEKVIVAEGYRTPHLRYSPTSAQDLAPQGWAFWVRRILWIICLVFAAAVIIMLLIASYNQL